MLGGARTYPRRPPNTVANGSTAPGATAGIGRLPRVGDHQPAVSERERHGGEPDTGMFPFG
jgi:hypothetical protein